MCVALLACSGGSGASDAGDSGDDDVQSDASDSAVGFPAPHPALPQAVNSGGSVIASPKVVAISFQGDTLQPDIDAFVGDLETVPAYWSGAVSEYGVGALTQVVYHAQEAAPSGTIGDSDVQTWISNKIQNDSTFPQPDASTIYAIFYPSGTTVALGADTTCDQLQGYHDSYPLSSSSNVIYAVIPRCPAPVQNISIADQMTAEASHEIIEAATDPLPSLKPAYLDVDGNDHAWEVFGGEIGDLCAGFPDSFYTPTGFAHLVQRVWSNASAAASHDPCEPMGNSPYFNSAPVVSDTIHVAVGASLLPTMGVKLAVGASTTIPVDCFSDGPTSGPWKITMYDITADFYGEAAALDLSLDQDTCQNGDVVNLTIKLLRAVTGGAPFWIQSDLGNASSVWLGSVGSN